MKTILILFMASWLGSVDPCVEAPIEQTEQASITWEMPPNCETVHYAEPLDCPVGTFGSVSYEVTNCYIGKPFGFQILISSDTVQVAVHPCQPYFNF